MRHQTHTTSRFVLLWLLLAAALPLIAAAPATAQTAIDFNGSNQYITFGTASGLGLPEFTLECWFKREGTGVAASTGTGGLEGANSAIPLITKGRGEADGSIKDMNYFFGIRSNGNVIAADFEDIETVSPNNNNHPIAGITSIQNGIWYHAAATYDGATWRLYLNGNFENELIVNKTPRSDSIQHAAIATAIDSTGARAGYFNGVIDEVRIWNRALTQQEIQSNRFLEITSGTGLVGRWGLNEGSGNTIVSSVGSFPGTLTNSPVWVDGLFTPPSMPEDFAAVACSNQIQLSWTGPVTNATTLTLERSSSGIGGPFETLTNLPLNATKYIDSTANSGPQYCYRLRGSNDFGEDISNEDCAIATPAEPNKAIYFGGSSYVTFGQALPSLGLSNFTIECWFKRVGTGAITTTGTGGITSAIPLVTKGRGEAEGSNVDMNWFLGINNTGSVIAADFEDTATGLNHPVSGVKSISNGVWYHAAATYDGTTWRLYLNGSFESQSAANATPRFDSIQHAAIATAMTSTGTTAGFFDGLIDEVRIWNYARSLTQILSTINSQITTPQAGLVARWGLDECGGTSVVGSAGTAVNGNFSGTSYALDDGAPFDIPVNYPPNQPVIVAPADHAANVAFSPILSVDVSDPEAAPMTVEFYGRPAGNESFSIIVLPDTQFYSESYPLNYTAQTQWIVNSMNSLNIAYVAHLGDIVNAVSTVTQWTNAAAAMAILENPTTTGLPDGIPYGVVPGNHDQPTGNYNTYFGISRFSGRDYYGGNFNGLDNDNNYTLFSAGGMDFIVVNLEYIEGTPPDPNVLAWANNLLQINSTRRAIVVSHSIILTGNPGSFSSAGQAIYDALKNNPNLFLMLCGHTAGEGYRLGTRTGMNPVHILLADYQSRSNGGDGWLRILEFVPEADQIRVKTYTPVLGQYETDPDSQFNLSYDMPGEGYQLLGVDAGVPSGSTASITWPAPGLNPFTEYEWYVTVTDGERTTTGPTWFFSTTGILGDINGDCDVDGSDLAAFINALSVYNPKADIEPIGGDGDVDANDLYEFAFDYGTLGCP